MRDTLITKERLEAAHADLERPGSAAFGLEGLFYGPEFFRIEQEQLFPSSWCVVTIGSAIPEPGDMLPIDLAGWPILVLRDRDGAIRAFHNICRHRAIQLVQQPCSRAKLIRCPWHSWSYDLTGKLLATPEIGGPGVHSINDFDPAQLGLKPIPVGQWLDYIFVNLDAKAAPFAEHIRPLEALLADLDMTDLHHGGRLDALYKGNWKLSTESGLEDYHLPYGHPQLEAHRFRNNEACGAPGLFFGGMVSLGSDEEEAGSVRSNEDVAQLPRLTRRDGRALDKLLLLTVYPLGTMLVSPNHLMIGILLPDGPDRTNLQLHFYYKGEAATSAEHAAARDTILKSWHEVVPQDYPFIEGTQAAIFARDGAGIRTQFSPYWEQAIRNFQLAVLDSVM